MLRMLFVDDEEDAHLVWAYPLQLDHGWKVTSAMGPQAAIEALGRAKFDVVVVDRLMPDPKTGHPGRMWATSCLRKWPPSGVTSAPLC